MSEAAHSLDAYSADPSVVVALVGLQHLHAAFSLRSRTPLDEPQPRYLSFSAEAAFADYQPQSGGAQPDIILKHGWLHKHMYVVPAVTALLCVWDASTSASAISAQVDAVRRAGRSGSRLVLVLVQARDEVGPLSPGVDDRLSALRRVCELEARCIVVASAEGVGPAQALEGAAVTRVEKLVLEAASAYYKDESRRPRKPKNASPQLLVRHHVKRAFYCEIVRDGALAQRHWQMASSQLRELLRAIGAIGPPSSEAERSAASSVTLHEVKRVAEYVNRKICHAAFAIAARQAEVRARARVHPCTPRCTLRFTARFTPPPVTPPRTGLRRFSQAHPPLPSARAAASVAAVVAACVAGARCSRGGGGGAPARRLAGQAVPRLRQAPRGGRRGRPSLGRERRRALALR